MSENINIYLWRVASIAVFTTCILLIIYVVLPYVALTLEKYQVYSIQKESLELVGDWGDQLEELNEKQHVLNASMQTIYVGLPKEQEFSSVVSSLFTTAKSSNVSISKIEPSESISIGNQLKKEFSLELRSEYHNLARFINRVEQGDYLINLQRMSIESNPAMGSMLESTITFELTMQNGVE
ncbi:hypothetical protein A8B79_05875 [Balneola sp. EhC07]|uniref:type 4a pilus biogenesis protein PilO n=1 Tax=Balneola sp. EhC07 TaxID=1849360 RepID=UPI0007F4FF16|nr:type 4a pilus biogenesis protein PilO [Balneola sp. EhC07]OAN61003.1 hypothetical protein A8B79_05875 [Balneola sp. EhC07]